MTHELARPRRVPTKKNVRDRMSLLILPMDHAQFAKYVVRKFLLDGCIHVKGISPAKCGYEHVFCFRHVEVPGIPIGQTSMVCYKDRAYLALRNFISRTLTRASVGLMGSIVTFHIVYGVDPASGLSGNASVND